jgi:single-strand DNA-binding protein
MSNVNKLIMTGNLGGDPALKKVGEQSVCEFSLATNDRWHDKDGNKREHVEWTPVVVWGKRGEVCAKYLKKGREVYVEGRKKTREWEKDGVRHRVAELIASDVQFLGARPADEGDDSDHSDRSDNSDNSSF